MKKIRESNTIAIEIHEMKLKEQACRCLVCNVAALSVMAPCRLMIWCFSTESRCPLAILRCQGMRTTLDSKLAVFSKGFDVQLLATMLIRPVERYDIWSTIINQMLCGDTTDGVGGISGRRWRRAPASTCGGSDPTISDFRVLIQKSVCSNLKRAEQAFYFFSDDSHCLPLAVKKDTNSFLEPIGRK